VGLRQTFGGDPLGFPDDAVLIEQKGGQGVNLVGAQESPGPTQTFSAGRHGEPG
jgi:hypothetical protein